MYSCPPMPPAPCPPDCPPSKPKDDESSKYYREIGTEMIGNRLIIRMEREKGKSRKLKDWDPPCDCDVVIQRPTGKEGPKILKVADNNQILFRIESRSSMSKKDGNEMMPQAVSYEVGQCRGGPNTNDQCRTVTIYPVADSAGAQQVHTDRLTLDDENVFLLKVKNKPDADDKPRKNIELEMRTPKPPSPSAAPTSLTMSSSTIKLSESEKVALEAEEDCFKAGAPPKPTKRDKKRKKKRR
ncbi:uncharacterized protein LOC108628704 [Ceratina calcarata]|uniref:Uncharacterized protein LOC108628704 n=1 Tax=Ceratina calcarata TaxID=156304 RepID=A0AAJ7S7X3_9HYME|nr:uncharacterized protein LOC108628704 [Ceratina calcarata]XP_026672557.1 uncharacterized protein LOC108628704 [Ceratina calcarata]